MSFERVYDLFINLNAGTAGPLAKSLTSLAQGSKPVWNQNDDFTLRLWFLTDNGPLTTPTLTPLDDGAAIFVAGRPSSDLEESSVLFLASGFTAVTDDSGTHYEGTINLNTLPLSDALTGLALLNVLVDVQIENAGDSQRMTIPQFGAVITRAVYRGEGAPLINPGCFPLTDGATIDLDTTLGQFYTLTISENPTFDFLGAHFAGRIFFLEIIQDATGGHTVTWPSGIVWSNSTVPTLTTTPLHGDILIFIDDGTNWIGELFHDNFAAAVPGVPAGLAATPISSMEIDLAWTATPGADWYNIYRNATLVGTSDTNSYDDTGLTASTEYSYTIAAANDYGASAQCTAVTATTLASSSSYALQFDDGGYVTVPGDVAFDSSGPITIEFWFNSSFTTDYQRIIGITPTAGSEGWRLECAADGLIYMAGPITGSLGPVTVPINTGDWVHVAVVLDGAGNGYIYINGELSASGSVTLPGTATGDLWIGAAEDGSYPVQGMMEQVRISNVVRYTGTFVPVVDLGTDANTVAYWEFDDGSGTTAADSSGNGHGGTLTGSPLPAWVTGI